MQPQGGGHDRWRIDDPADVRAPGGPQPAGSDQLAAHRERVASQRGTRVLVPGGQVFAEQNIILSAAVDDDMPRFHAPKLFMGAAAIGPDGIVQADFIVVAAKRRLIDRAEQIIVLADSSKFDSSSGQVVCGLEEIDIVITDAGVTPESAAMLERNGVKLLVAARPLKSIISAHIPLDFDQCVAAISRACQTRFEGDIECREHFRRVGDTCDPAVSRRGRERRNTDCCGVRAAQTSDPLASGFENPPASAKPRVWWHWIDGNVSEQGIREDLAWLNQVGVGGVHNFDAALTGGGAERATPRG